MLIEKQELHCHECQKYVQFEVDMSLDGNHVLNCPNCGHEHCRVVKNGRITSERWDSRNGMSFQITTATYSASSTYTTSTSTSYFLYTSWSNVTAVTG